MYKESHISSSSTGWAEQWRDGKKMILYSHGNQKRGEMAIPPWGKVKFHSKCLLRENILYQKDPVLSIYAPNIRSPSIQQYWHNKWENEGPGTESYVQVIFVPPQLIDKA